MLNNVPGKDKTLVNAEECKARGAYVIAVVSEGDEQAAREFDDVIVVPSSAGDDCADSNGGGPSTPILSHCSLADSWQSLLRWNKYG